MTSEALTRVPGVNQALIEQYLKANDLGNLMTLFDHLWKCKTRAEDLSRAYLAQMVTLQTELSHFREGRKESPQSQPAQPEACVGPQQTPAGTARNRVEQPMDQQATKRKPRTQAVDIEL